MKKVYAIVEHYGHQETILCYVSSKKKLAKKIKELLHNEKENGFFDDKNKSSKKIDEKKNSCIYWTINSFLCKV